MVVFGQPLDSLFGAAGLVMLLVGVAYAAWGGVTFMSAKGKKKLMGGLVALAIGGGLFFVFGSPVLPGTLNPTAPTAPGQWQVCLTNANYATVGLGTCANSMVASKAIPYKVQPGVNTTKDAADNAMYVYFNITVTPPSGSNKVSYNAIVATGSVPTLTNTTQPSTTAPVVALRTGGQYDVLITPSGGTGTYQTQTVPYTPGTSTVVGFQVHIGRIASQLSLGQYPVGVTVTFTVTDQSSGTLYGTISLSMTFT